MRPAGGVCVARLLLLHWHADEADARAGALRRAGHRVEVRAAPDIGQIRAIGAAPPDAILIDLSRVPSAGRAVGTWLRQHRATRQVPLVFVGGDPEKVAATRRILADATFTEWRGVRGAVRRALRRPPGKPVVPGTMDEYAGRPLPKKLGIRAGMQLSLLGAPRDFARTLGTLPEGTRVRRRAGGGADLALLFARHHVALARGFPAAARRVVPRGVLWIVWPKKASGVASDLGQNEVRAFGLAHGWVDFKVCAIDATWSGLAFVRRARRAPRKGEQP